jgi:hypothetical protein
MRRKKRVYDQQFIPGDALVFGGRGFESRMIELRTTSLKQKLTGQWISHIGICAEHESSVLHFESTTMGNLPCVIQGHAVRGVQANHPQERIDSYDGCVWRMRLDRRERLTPAQSKRLSGFLLDCLGIPYDTAGALTAGTLLIKEWFEPDGRQLFCDEMVAMALIDCGKVCRVFSPSAITPAWLVRWLIHVGFYRPLERLK